MQYSEGKIGRIFVARLEDGEPVYESLEKLCEQESVSCASVLAIGGIRKAGVIAGPEDPRTFKDIKPMVTHFDDAREIVGVGTVFPLDDGGISLHFHAGIGRGKEALVGCPRGAKASCFLIQEIVIIEWQGIEAHRVRDPETGFALLKLLGAKDLDTRGL